MNESPMAGWQVILTSLVFPAILAVWTAYRWWSDRAERKSGRELTREERVTKELDNQQAAMTRTQSDMFAQVRQDNADLRARNVELMRDRDRGWDLARYWHGQFHDLLRSFRNLRHDVNGTRQTVVVMHHRFMRDEPAPEFAPLPDLPTAPMGLEEPR